MDFEAISKRLSILSVEVNKVEVNAAFFNAMNEARKINGNAKDALSVLKAYAENPSPSKRTSNKTTE